MFDEWSLATSETRSPLERAFKSYRIDFGPGYRVYYGIDKGRIVLLLGGGTKRGQSRDIKNAIDRWTRHKERKG